MKKMKKFFTFFLAIMLVFACFAGCGQNNGDQSDKPSDDSSSGETPTTVEYDYYKNFKMNGDNKLLVWKGEDDNFAQAFTAIAIQGLFNRDEITYYNLTFSANELWLQDLKDTYGVTTETVTFDSMVNAYKEKFGADAKYILYDKAKNPESVNVATSLAGIFNAIPVDTTQERQFSSKKGYNMEKLMDVTEMTESDCYYDYKDKFATDALFQLSPDLWYPRDYWIAGKYYGFYQVDTDISTLAFRNRVQSWTDDDSPIFGWGPTTEGQDVTIASNNAEFTVASDTSANMTVLCSDAWGTSFTQKSLHKEVTAQKGKHYVCIMMSDGDNIQAVSNTFPFSAAYYLADRENFKMGWTLNVSCVDLQPSIMNYLYRNMDENDYFVASVSGAGYMYPSSYPQEALKLFTERLGNYLKRADCHSLQILEEAIDVDAFEYYSKIEGLYGCAVMSGWKYAAKHGSVYWKNGMPFVTCRFSLWETTGANIAAQVNACEKDPTSINGYSVINVHPWSTSYTDVVELVKNLDENTIVVTADNFFKMIRANVPQVDVDCTEN